LTFDQFISEEYNNLILASKKITNYDHLSEELLHECLFDLVQKNNLQEIVDSGGCTFYIVRMLLNNWRSTTSRFYRTYREPSGNIEDLADIPDNEYVETEEEIANEIEKILGNLAWYDQSLIKILVDETQTISSLSRQTNIPRTSISLSVNRTRKYVIKELKRQNLV